MNITFSDHRPVTATFEVITKIAGAKNVQQDE